MTHSLMKWIGLGAAALMLAACGSNEEEILAIAKAQKMSKQQTAAFKACAGDMRSRQPIFIDGKTAVQLVKVPLEVCACHSKSMVKLFKDDKLIAHQRFAAYIAKAKRKAELKFSRRDLKTGFDPIKGGAQMVESLRTCANDFVTKNAELGKDLIVPFELPKPKVKKKPEGEEGTPAEGEQQASKS